MSDGKIDIELDVNDSKASSKAKKAGQDIAKGVESGLKNVGKSADSAAKDIDKAFSNAGKSAKSSMDGVGSSAKSSFSEVGDAARSASSDAASAFEEIPADAAGAFADVGSEAQSGFDGVADAASTSASDASSAFESIPADAAGSFSDVGSEAEAGFSGVADAAKTAADGASDAFDEVGESIDEAGSHSFSFGAAVVAAGSMAADAITAVISKVGEFITNSIDAGKEFDKSMSQVAATMGKTTDEIGELTEFAKEMGAKTAFSATQASEALNYMALAGYDAKTSMDMLPVVLNLAAAGSMELATASDMVTDAQSALGLSLEDTVEMVDQMAMTSSKTNTSVEQLGNAFLTVGGTAKNLSGGTKELAQMLGILADNGIKGSEGGTALRNVILSLSAPTDVARGKIEDLGLAVFDAEGNMRPMPDIINDLNAAMEPLTQEEKTNALNMIFNKVDLKSVNALLGTSADRFDEVAASIDKAQGSAQKMADTQLDNFAGDVTLLDSAMEGLSIQISDALNPALRGFTQFLTNSIVPAISAFVANLDKIIPLVGIFGASLLALKGVPAIMNAVKSSTAGATTTITVMGKQFKLTGTAAKVAGVATKAFGTAANALKSALPVLALTAALEVLMMLGGAFKDAQEKSDNFRKATDGIKGSMDAYNEAFDSARSSMEGVSGSSSAVTASFADIRNAADEAISKTAELADSLNETFSEVGTNNAMVQNYADTIAELADKSNLTAEEQGALINAVSGLNDIMGTSYEVVDAQNGILSANTDEILASADAWQKRALMEAQAAASAEIMKQMVENTTALTKAEDVLATTQEKLAQAQERGEQDLTQYRLGVEQAQAEVDRLKEVQEGLEQEQLDLNKATARLNDELNSSSDAIKSYAEGTDAWSSALADAGADIDDFAGKLSDLGVSTEDLARIMAEKGEEGIRGFIEAYQSGGDSLAEWMRSEMGVEIGEAARTAGSNAGQGFSSGLSESAQMAIDAALQITGMTRAEFDRLAEEAGIEGEEAGIAFANSLAVTQPSSVEAANAITTATQEELDALQPVALESGEASGTEFAGGIESKAVDSGTAGQINATMALEGFKSQDNYGAGSKAGGDFAGGVQSHTGDSGSAGAANASSAYDGMSSADYDGAGESAGGAFASGVDGASRRSETAGQSNANSAETGMKSKNTSAKSWGSDLVSNFASGIRSMISFVSSAANAVASAVASVLHFSQPEKGVWSGAERGGERSGLHLVQNFAKGMTSAKAKRDIQSATKEIAVDISDSLQAELAGINPMAQLQASITQGNSALSMSSMMVGAAPSYNDYSMKMDNTFNGMQSPADIIRAQRLAMRYELAGKYV